LLLVEVEVGITKMLAVVEVLVECFKVMQVSLLVLLTL
jgi:hypothetical protein